MKHLALILSIFVLSSCSHTKVRRYAPFDERDKSIKVPIWSGVEFIADVKDYFYQHGYEVLTYEGGKKETKIDAKTNLTKNEHDARYILNFTYSPVELFIICLGGQEVSYWVSVADTQTGREVLSMSGNGCSNSIFKKFKKALDLK